MGYSGNGLALVAFSFACSVPVAPRQPGSPMAGSFKSVASNPSLLSGKTSPGEHVGEILRKGRR